jgi:hypothetical protein
MAVDRAREREAEGVVRVSLLTTIAISFVVPRLGRFAARHPGVELRLETSTRLVDFDREPVDAAIRYGDGQYAGLHADCLFDDALTPLCTPEIAARIRRPEDLFGLALGCRRRFAPAAQARRDVRLDPPGGRRGDGRCRCGDRGALHVRGRDLVGPARPAVCARRSRREVLLGRVPQAGCRAPDDQGIPRMDTRRDGAASRRAYWAGGTSRR